MNQKERKEEELKDTISKIHAELKSLDEHVILERFCKILPNARAGEHAMRVYQREGVLHPEIIEYHRGISS